MRTTHSGHVVPARLVVAVAVCYAAAAAAVVPDPQAGFPVTLNGDHVRYGSTAVGDLDGDGVVDVVVGATDGKVHAYTGYGVKLWEYDTGAMGIESKAAIADVDADGHAEVIVGAGSPSHVDIAHGGLYVLSHLGGLQCQYLTGDIDGDGFREGVFASPAVAELDGGGDGGRLEIAFTAWDRTLRVINHDCSLVWEKNVWDTPWSSPAIGDLDNDGDLDIVVGAPISSAITGYSDGGLLHAVDGATGAWLAGFPIQVDEQIDSSPALGDIDGDGLLDVVVGSGYCWANPACAPGGNVHPGVGRWVAAYHHDGSPVTGWPVSLGVAYSFASPALADLDEDGVLEVIVNSIDPADVEGGMVYALHGDGSPLPGWPLRPTVPKGTTGDVKHNSTQASPVVGDLDGDGHLDVVLPCSWELVVWDRLGNQLTRDTFPPAAGQWTLAATFSIASSPAVADLDDDGDVELVVGGGTTAPIGPPGAIYAWDFTAAASDDDAVWPMFRRDATNNAVVELGLIFRDGFESGSTSGWTAVIP